LRQGLIGDGGRELCAALSGALDEAIGAQGWEGDASVAIVALGGYGRGELSPHSDIDLMLLHRLEDPSDAAARLFRPLWDAGLRVGHSVRTVAEAGSAARERFDTQTTLLTARLVAGNAAMWDELVNRVTAVTRARPLRRHLVAEERERRRQWPYLVMAPDLKNGRGGLRVLQGLDWERRREALIGRFTAHPSPEEESAAEILLRARNALHVVTGRPGDVLSPELRGSVARWLGGDERETIQSVIDATHLVDGLAARHWPEALPSARRQRRSRGSGPRSRAAPTRFARSPLAELMQLLESGEVAADERHGEDGVLARTLPGWDEVWSRAQLEPFHEHPVGAHLWRTVDEMRFLIADDGHYGRVASEVGSPETLLLAALLHDIGKGRGDDHSAAGAEIARSACARLGVPLATAAIVEQVVRHHLLLATTATRRDLDDPAVIDEVVELIGDLETLQTLYLVTVADSKATGPTMWNPWKAALLRALFTRCAARFGGDRAITSPSTREELASQAREVMRDEVVSHLAAMPDAYVRDNGIDDVLWHIRLLAEAGEACAIGVREDLPLETAVVAGRIGPAVRARVGEAFAAHGIDVVEARMTTSGERMVDTFRVRDDRTGGQVPAERWDRVRNDLSDALSGGAGAGERLAARVASYPTAPVVEPEARVTRDPASGAVVITVKCSDRIGRLAEILGVLDELGLVVSLAKLESRGQQVVDTFHVEDGPSGEEESGALATRIAGMIST
jgi:[protein-PII] uridylyltransferase